MIRDIIFTITHPSYWHMNYPYNATVDAKLRELAEKHTFERIYIAFGIESQCEVKLGDVVLWVENQPHASFAITIDNKIPRRRYRPSRRTIHMLIQKLNRELNSD